MDKRYQVFVSSTFQDLQEERQEVMQALLELDCMPSGMELFPAANFDQWTLIKKVIDDSDYYMVIIGGRYGSIGPEGISYTEMEYRYALESGKPVIAFLHKNPGELKANRTEKDPESIGKLDEFRRLAEKKLVKYWTTPSDLGSMVSRSLIRLIKTTPAIGWVKADQVPDESASKEILKLRKQIEELEGKLIEARKKAPQGAEYLAQGADEIILNFIFVTRNKKNYNKITNIREFSTTWDELFSRVGPLMIDEAKEESVHSELNEFVVDKQRNEIISEIRNTNSEVMKYYIEDSDFQTIKIQLRALGLINKSTKQRSLKDIATYWTLTPYGDEILTQLRAIKRRN